MLDSEKRFWTVPNVLSLFRIALIPLFVWCFFTPFANHLVWAIAVFVSAGITDVIDGYIARHFHQISLWGRILDPMADKLMVCTALICQGVAGVIPWWAIIVVMGKELLMELADPQGREITWYESPRLKEIYFTRDHRVNPKRDYSFQLHYADYDETDPHWELIYYLGKYGAVDNGYIRLTEADWDSFVAFSQELQLEYFPEQTKSDDDFKCHLLYTDDHYKNVVLNKETEELLKAYFMKLVQQNQT